MHARVFIDGFADTLAAGFRFNVRTVLLLAAINTGIAAVLWIDDTRPFWHPLLTVQLYGFSIAYCVNAAAPWSKPRPILRLAIAVAIGTCIGLVLTILVKGYSLSYVMTQPSTFASNAFAGFANGLFVSLFFYVKFRESQAAITLHKAEVERHLLSKQAIEAELKLMQAQVEPHFLFNTLANVRRLFKTDPPAAHAMLEHLSRYLGAMLPRMRKTDSTIGHELALALAYLSVQKIRMGARLSIRTDVPDTIASLSFPPMMLVTLVENAIRHGLTPLPDGGEVRILARVGDGKLRVQVVDTGAGLSESSGAGVGLANVRARLSTVYGGNARFLLAENPHGGVTATIEVPAQAAPAAVLAA